MSTCGECKLFKCLCSGRTGHCNLSGLKYQDDKACLSFRLRCQLPRVGSKEWDWRKDPTSYFDLELHIDSKLAYGLLDYTECERAQIIGASGVALTLVDSYLQTCEGENLKARRKAAIRFAKDMCELHARREWMRKTERLVPVGALPKQQ